MSDLSVVITFAGESAVRHNQTTYLFVSDPPPPRTVITIDPKKARVVENVERLPVDGWRRIELHEFLEPTWPVMERRRASRQVGYAYSVAEITDFCEEFVNDVLRRAREVTVAADQDVLKRLQQHRDFIQIFGFIVASLPSSMSQLQAQITARVDRERVDAFLDQSNYSSAHIAGLMDELNDGPQRLRLMKAWLDMLGAAEFSNEQIETELLAMPALKAGDMLNNQVIWSRIAEMFDFAQDLGGETIDLSDAREVRFVPMQPYLDAKRVGRIKPQRPALLVYQSNSRFPEYVIGADRRLQFRVVAAGGSLHKWGVTFTMGSVGDDSFAQALIEVERLELLANVDPMAAVDEIRSELSDDHPIHAAALKAQTDHRWGRILADLLIEFTVGLDADIARRLIRSRSSSR